MTKEDFWNLIDISDEEKEKSLFFLRHRGILEHDLVRKYLESITGRRVKYSDIASTFRYDKKIRRVIYKYIGLLEESIRAYIINKYADKEHIIDLIKKIQKREDDLYNAISELTLGEIYHQLLLMPNDWNCFFDYEENNGVWKKEDFVSIVELRNQISHNRFILDNMKLKECSIGDHNASLWANLMNLKRFLPKEVKEKFVQEINGCSEIKENKIENQVCIDLPSVVIIVLE